MNSLLNAVLADLHALDTVIPFTAAMRDRIQALDTPSAALDYALAQSNALAWGQTHALADPEYKDHAQARVRWERSADGLFRARFAVEGEHDLIDTLQELVFGDAPSKDHGIRRRAEDTPLQLARAAWPSSAATPWQALQPVALALFETAAWAEAQAHHSNHAGSSVYDYAQQGYDDPATAPYFVRGEALLTLMHDCRALSAHVKRAALIAPDDPEWVI